MQSVDARCFGQVACWPRVSVPAARSAATRRTNDERCRTAGAVVLGGHTVRDVEIKFGLAATGTIHPQRILTNAAAYVECLVRQMVRMGDHAVVIF